MRWKERLKISKIARFESDLMKTNEDIAPQSHLDINLFFYYYYYYYYHYYYYYYIVVVVVVALFVFLL